MRTFILTALLIIFNPFSAKPQDSILNQPPLTAFNAAALVYQLASRGYAQQDALALYHAAILLIESPVKGEFRPERVQYPDTVDATTYIPLQPEMLLKDALKFCKDETLGLLIVKASAQISENEPKDRGRQYSPYVQQYSINALGSISLLTTFIGSEIAEIFVVNNSDIMLDLIIFDNNGKSFVSDLNRIAGCYVSFIPAKTSSYKIQIRNKGNKSTNCLLMTN